VRQKVIPENHLLFAQQPLGLSAKRRLIICKYDEVIDILA